MMKRHFALLPIIIPALWLAGCQKSEQPPEPPPVDPHPKTLIFYGNIGEPYYGDDIREAGQAVAAGALIGGQRIIVYGERTAGNVIYELVRDRSNSQGFRRDTLKKYAPGEVSTMNPGDMKTILGEIREMAPSEHYGLAFGAHGRGWLPKTYDGPLLRAMAADPLADLWETFENPVTRFLGHGNSKIDISEFAEAAGSMTWDFVLLDACFMGSVEAVYEMRNVADYLIASPAEIMIEGFPYHRIVSSLFADWSDMAAIAHIFVDYYRTGGSFYGPYATISVVKTSELDRLAQAVRNIRIDGYSEPDAAVAAKMQAFEAKDVHVFYDLDHYIGYWAQNPFLYGQFLQQLQKTVVYKEHTDKFYSVFGNGDEKNPGTTRPYQVPIMHYSGLTAFIPTAATISLIADYRNTSWYKAVYED